MMTTDNDNSNNMESDLTIRKGNKLRKRAKTEIGIKGESSEKVDENQEFAEQKSKKKKKRKREEKVDNNVKINISQSSLNDINEGDRHLKNEMKEKKNKKRATEEIFIQDRQREMETKETKKKKKREREDVVDTKYKSAREEDKDKTSFESLKQEQRDGQLLSAAATPKTKSKKQKRENEANNDLQKSIQETRVAAHSSSTTVITTNNNNINSIFASVTNQSQQRRPFPVDYQYILAPMVGASELPFRLLCRKYGAQLCYTPMMSATQFVRDAAYRQAELQTISEDRPLVCHFAANDPDEFAQAAKLAEPYCDAIDLNLGCPQRTAYVGHFGSYLLDPVDRALVLQTVSAGAKAVSIPICCKIRLLGTLEDTIQLCQQLQEAGAALIAIHARYRASWERTGPGARDGPAMLDQVTEIRKHVHIPIIANGNTKTYDDVVTNLELTQADGLMSAEGILDNPALFLPRFGSKEKDGEKLITITDPLAASSVVSTSTNTTEGAPGLLPLSSQQRLSEGDQKKQKKLMKKLREIERIEQKMKTDGEASINKDQREKLATKSIIEQQLSDLDPQPPTSDGGVIRIGAKRVDKECIVASATNTAVAVPLRDLYNVADDNLQLANEYLSLVRRYPTKIRTVVFHTRRMLRSMLEQYQLMEDLVAATSVDQVQEILNKCRAYRDDPKSFEYDRDKAKRQKEALEKRRHEEGKRKAFEARMMRKAKREGKSDLSYYLRQGSQLPSVETIEKLKRCSKEEQLSLWKELDHSQHCLAFHLDPNGCKRDRACAFLHVEAKNANTFDESDEVAG
jgi:tRNA-dihydrouridine synthase 1